jgi:hypothetical protein
MTQSIRFIAAYEAVAGLGSLVTVGFIVHNAPLSVGAAIDLGLLILLCVASTIAGFLLWRRPTSATARELSFAVLGAQIPHLTLPGFAFSITAGLSFLTRIVGGSLNIAWAPEVSTTIQLGHHDAPFELGMNVVPLFLLLALRRALIAAANAPAFDSSVAAG